MIAYLIDGEKASEVEVNEAALIDDVRRHLGASNVDYHVIAPGASDHLAVGEWLRGPEEDA